MCPSFSSLSTPVVLLVAIGLVRGVPSDVLALFLRGSLSVFGGVLYNLSAQKLWELFRNDDFPPFS